MKWWLKKKEEPKEESKEKLTVEQRLKNIEIELESIGQEIRISGEKRSVHMMYVSNKDSKDPVSEKALMMVGNPTELIKLIVASGLKESQFGAVIIAAAAKISMRDSSLKKLKDDLDDNLKNGDCDCDDCRAERGENPLLRGELGLPDGIRTLKDLANMSKKDIDEMVKNIERKNRRKE